MGMDTPIEVKKPWREKHPVLWTMLAGASGLALGFFLDTGHLFIERHLERRDRIAGTNALIEFVRKDCEAKQGIAVKAMEEKVRKSEQHYRAEVERIGNIASGRGMGGGGEHLRNVELAKMQHDERVLGYKLELERRADSCSHLIDSIKAAGGLND